MGAELDMTRPGWIAPIRTKDLPDQVYDALLDMLTSGSLAPDSPLAIDGLARSLGVSPTPVREALARLEHTGLVNRTARRGYRVAPPMSQHQMAELADARLVFEVGAMERAMKHADELLPDIETAFRNHRHSAESLISAGQPLDHDRLRDYFRDDWSFHQAVLDHCGNRYIARSVNALSFSLHRMRQTISLGTTDACLAVSEHQAILEAVRGHDAVLAAEQMRKHLQNVEQRSSS